MKRLNRPGAVMGLFALGLEATGVASGAYVYGDFPIKILGVPLCIPVMWVLVMALAYVVSLEHGPLVGVLVAYRSTSYWSPSPSTRGYGHGWSSTRPRYILGQPSPTL